VRGFASIVSMPSLGDWRGEAWEAMACREWKVDPMRRESFVFRGGEEGEKEVEYIKPPDLFTMKRWRNMMRGVGGEG